MNRQGLARFVAAAFYGTALPIAADASRAAGQSEPTTIPTIVAQSMALEPEMLGRPHFFDGKTPPDWPVALTPAGAKVVGSGVIGDSAMYRLRAVVFEFSPSSNPSDVLKAMFERAGYLHPALEVTHPSGGGFVSTPQLAVSKYCRGSTLATFGAMDSLHTPLVVTVYLIDGEAGRQSCTPHEDPRTIRRFPVTVPPLSPPPGASAFGGGSSWDGSGGDMRTSLRTTMPADSILEHYSEQLVAGGWKREGRPAVADGVGVQRFSLREGQDAWTGALIVLVSGDRREVRVQVNRNE